MSRIFTANVVIAKDRGGEAVEFKVGDKVPAWAEALVGDHVCQGTTRAADAPAPEDVPVDAATETQVVADDEDLDSYLNWTKAELKDEAKGREIAGYSNMSKEELAAALEADDAEEA